MSRIGRLCECLICYVLKMCFLLVIVYLNVVCKANVCTDELSLGRIYTATTEWRRKKWTTAQSVNMIYVNCRSSTVSFL